MRGLRSFPEAALKMSVSIRLVDSRTSRLTLCGVNQAPCFGARRLVATGPRWLLRQKDRGRLPGRGRDLLGRGRTRRTHERRTFREAQRDLAEISRGQRRPWSRCAVRPVGRDVVADSKLLHHPGNAPREPRPGSRTGAFGLRLLNSAARPLSSTPTAAPQSLLSCSVWRIPFRRCVFAPPGRELPAS